jgi:hypothetical protein
MIALGMIWAMLGPRSIAVIATVVLVLYGRSGVFRSPQVRALLRPWTAPPAQARAAAAAAAAAETEGKANIKGKGWTREDRVFWFLTIVAAAAVAAWVVTRTMIVSGPGSAH